MRACRFIALGCLLAGCGSAGPVAEAGPGAEPGSARRSGAVAAGEPSRPSEPAFSIATYNINFGNGHAPETVDAIAGLGADIVLLQETTEASEQAIRAALASTYPEIHFHHCCRAGGLGVLSRFEIHTRTVIEPTVGVFPAWGMTVETPGGPVTLVDVHLRPPMSDSGSWVVGFFSTRAVRAREIASLWRSIPQDDPIIVAGDFNEKASGGVMEFLAAQGLQSALPEFAGKEPTWHWRVGATTLRMQLDHVAYGGGLQPTDARVVRGGLSDHEPVVVDLAWNRD